MTTLVKASEFTTKHYSVTRLVLDNLKQPVILIDTQLQVVFANKRANEDTKMLLGKELSPGDSMIELVHHLQRPFYQSIYNEVLNGETRKTEFSFNKPDGTIAFYENDLTPAVDEFGDIVGLISISTDITEKKKGENALRLSEERWRFALEGSLQGVWDWDLQTGECFYSAGYHRMYGYEEGELNGDVVKWESRIHPDDREQMQQLSKQQILARKKYVSSSYRMLTKNGKYIWVEALGMLTYDESGEPIRMVGTHTDISERLKHEDDLKQSFRNIEIAHERFNMMMKATNDLVWDWDVKANEFYRGDDGLKRVYGVESHEEINTAEKWMRRVHPEDLKNVQTSIADILLPSQLKTFELEYRFKRDDGEWSYVYDRGIVLRDAAGAPLRIIGAAQNISDRKKLEEQILQKELEHKKLLYKATIDTQEEERTEIGRELHDNVNQMLTSTKLLLDMASVSGSNKDELIRRAIDNIYAVIKDIRMLSRSLMDPTIHDLGIIDSISELTENFKSAKKLTVFFHYNSDIENFLNKNQKLATFRIIQESLNNIAKHANASYTSITLSSKQNLAELIIEDDGQGFNSKQHVKGKGLKNIENRVFLIDGSLSVESNPGKGSRLIIRFPIEKPHHNE